MKMLSGSGRILRARGRLTSVQQETKAELMIDQPQDCETLGLEVPPDAARPADKVIE